MTQSRPKSVLASLSCVAGLLGLLGCVSTPRELPPLDPAAYGLSACKPEVMTECRRISDKTFHSIGPRQVEYHSPEGRVFLWVGDRIVRGYWAVIPSGGLIASTRICYLYEGEVVSDCRPLGNKGTHPEVERAGDPYGLAERTQPPFNLRELPAFAGSFDVVDAKLAELR